MANVIAQLGRPAIVFAPNKTLAAQLYSEFREFFPKNAVEYFVSYYDYYQPEAYVPQRDLFIEKDSSINEHIEQMRLSATKSVLERRDVVIVATRERDLRHRRARGLHADALHRARGRQDRPARHHRAADPHAVQRATRQDFSRGTFRVRGDTIDVFPAEHSELAIRIRAVRRRDRDRCSLFDPLTGRIRQKVPRFTVYPSSHYVTPRDEWCRRDRDHQGWSCDERLDVLRRGGQAGRGAARSEQRTRFDLEMLPEIGHCKGIENYTRHLSGAAPGDPPPTLIDYLPQDALMFLDESHQMIGQLGGMYNGDRARKTTLVEYGFRLPSRAGQPAAQVRGVRDAHAAR